MARLYAAPEFRRQLEAQFEGKLHLTYDLAPPLLGSTDADGRPVKRRFGAWTQVRRSTCSLA